MYSLFKLSTVRELYDRNIRNPRPTKSHQTVKDEEKNGVSMLYPHNDNVTYAKRLSPHPWLLWQRLSILFQGF